MAKVHRFSALLSVLALLLGCAEAHARWELDLESGAVFSGYNDVQIPRESGSLISLSEELTTDPGVFFRARATYSVSDKHSLSILVAPLRLGATGTLDRRVWFEGEEFPANTPLKAIYRFDSYRLTYRYRIVRTGGLEAGLGLTAKIRDAAISVENGNTRSEKKNTGFVPLINFRLNWMFVERLRMGLEGDALAAPQGRAEDILLAMQYEPVRNVGLKLGYRVLEGGADVAEVYNFALLHYLVLGAVARF